MANEKLDLIDRKKLLNKKKYSFQTVFGCFPKNEWFVKLEDVFSAPTVDAVEVVHARWVKEWNREHLFKICYCSACKKGANKDVHDEYILSDYCPHCGAKMDGGNEDENS